MIEPKKWDLQLIGTDKAFLWLRKCLRQSCELDFDLESDLDTNWSEIDVT